jgi:siroheme synthase
VVSGHSPDAYGTVLTSLAPQSATVVVLMGLASIGRIATVMLDRGWNGSTAAAIIRGAATAAADVWTGCVADLANGMGVGEGDAPGTVVIGDVVRVGAMLATGMIQVTGSENSDDEADSLGAVAVR